MKQSVPSCCLTRLSYTTSSRIENPCDPNQHGQVTATQGTVQSMSARCPPRTYDTYLKEDKHTTQEKCNHFCAFLDEHTRAYAGYCTECQFIQIDDGLWGWGLRRRRRRRWSGCGALGASRWRSARRSDNKFAHTTTVTMNDWRGICCYAECDPCEPCSCQQLGQGELPFACSAQSIQDPCLGHMRVPVCGK